MNLTLFATSILDKCGIVSHIESAVALSTFIAASIIPVLTIPGDIVAILILFSSEIDLNSCLHPSTREVTELQHKNVILENWDIFGGLLDFQL